MSRGSHAGAADLCPARICNQMAAARGVRMPDVLQML